MTIHGTDTKPKNDFTALLVSRKAGTMQLMHECHALAGLDEYGRKPPLYVVLHQALAAYKHQLTGDGGANIESPAALNHKRPRRVGP